jgi:AmmeMemoRadiSam system protein A
MLSHLTKAQGATLLNLARNTLTYRLRGGNPPSPLVEPDFLCQRAVFVTLTIAGKLRGCIGNLVPVGSLWEGVRNNALNAALHDHRFSALTAEDLDNVTIEISVLTPPETLVYEGSDDLVEKLRVGVDGVILRKEGRSATFLPQVWDQLATPELFLDHLCSKAGFGKGCWREADVSIETYQVESFSEGKL